MLPKKRRYQSDLILTKWQRFIYQVNMGYEHSPAAVPFQAEVIEDNFDIFAAFQALDILFIV